MERKRIYSGSAGEKRVGYCRAIVLSDPHGDWIYVSGTTGFDYQRDLIDEDPAAQTEQALRNIKAALQQAGASMADTYYYRVWLRDAAIWEAVAPVLARWFDDIHPASIAAIAPAMDQRIRVEIELEARKAPAG